jgi:ABC-type multidrug transport system ATPase subunit
MVHTLEIDSVQKSYNNKLILSDIYLKCESKNIIGLLGRNGSGKSTLLKIIFGIVEADNKFVRVDSIVKSTTSQLLREIAYLDQSSFIPKNLSVKKAICLCIEKNERDDFYADLIIKPILKNKISELSGGELRYLEIKLVLQNEAKFVLLDEPYNGLSPFIIEKINDLIIKNAKNKGVIITDHDYKNVIKISTQLILMKEGKTHHLKNKEELTEKGYLSEGMI